jgi:hypothetical protein
VKPLTVFAVVAGAIVFLFQAMMFLGLVVGPASDQSAAPRPVVAAPPTPRPTTTTPAPTTTTTTTTTAVPTSVEVAPPAVAQPLVPAVPKPAPAPRTTTTKKTTTQPPPPPPSSDCDPNYSGCVPVASDVDCAGGSGNGPAYVSGPIRVIGRDVYGLDADHDGIACERG